MQWTGFEPTISPCLLTVGSIVLYIIFCGHRLDYGRFWLYFKYDNWVCNLLEDWYNGGYFWQLQARIFKVSQDESSVFFFNSESLLWWWSKCVISPSCSWWVNQAGNKERECLTPSNVRGKYKPKPLLFNYTCIIILKRGNVSECGCSG